MGTSSSAPAPKILFRIVDRPNLWFHAYDHCLRFYINEGSALRYQSHEAINRTIARRKEWGRRMAQGYQPGSWSWKPLEISDSDLANLHAMCDFFLSEQRTYKLMISGNWLYLYTRDTSLIDDVIGISFLDPKKMLQTQVKLVGQPGTIIQKKPKHSRRSFFRSMGLTLAQRDSLFGFLDRQDKIRLSPSLKYAITSQHTTRTMDYFFIDHDDDSVLIMLSLIVPNIIRRTLPITAHK
jgi:hypothetical protein